MRGTPTFVGWRALVLHREDDGIQRLVRQLQRLGLAAEICWAPLDPAAALPQVIFVDADQGWNGLLPWTDGAAPGPVVALLGSEAPGRIAWAMGQGAGAIIAKPIAPSAVYPALVMAAAIHAERQAAGLRAARLEERIRLRPLVHGAVETIMAAHGIDEEHAYRLLQMGAMRRRLGLEQLAAAIVAGAEPLPETG